MGRLARVAGATILTVIIVVMAAWLASPQLASWLVGARFAGLGFDRVILEMSRPGLDHVRIARLSLRDSRSGAAVSLDGIEAGFTPAGLARGMLRSVVVTRAVITLPAGQRPAAALALPATLPDLPAGPWLAWVPEHGVTINEFAVVDNEGEPLIPDFSARLTGTGDTALLTARPLSAAARDRLLEVVVDDTGRAGGALTTAGTSGPPALEFGLAAGTGGERRWTVQLATELSHLIHWIEPIHSLADQPASCMVVIHAELGENPLDAIGASAELGDCAWPGGKLAHGTLRGRFMRTARGVASVSPVTVALRDFAMTPAAGRSLELRVGVDVDLENGVVSLLQGSSADFGPAAVGALSIEPFAATLAETLAVTPAGAGEIARIDIPAVAVDWGEGRAELNNTRAELSLAGAGITRLDATTRLALESQGYGARFADATIELDWSGDLVRGSIRGMLGGAMPVTAVLEVDAGTGAGTITVDGAPHALGFAPARASELVGGWPAGIDLVSGTIAFGAEARFDEGGLDIRAHIALDQAGGVVEGVYFSDASTRVDLLAYPEFATREPAVLKVAVVDYGVSLNDLTASVTIDGFDHGLPRIVASDVSAHVFDGIVRLPRASVGGGAFQLILDGIDLGEVVGREQFAGLRIEGRVNGRVPVEITPEGLYIDGGTIENVGGGIIQYDAGDFGGGGRADILFRALKDFEYTVLRAEPNYQSDGTLVLRVHLEGTSEEVGRNQPIHLNVNVEQNLLSLLESIRLVNGLNDRIDSRVQQFYERRSP